LSAIVDAAARHLFEHGWLILEHGSNQAPGRRTIAPASRFAG